MTHEEILSGIEAVAREQLDWTGPVDEQTRLVEDLELDSLKSLTLAVEVENRFRVRLDPEMESRIVTIGDLVAAIRCQLDG